MRLFFTALLCCALCTQKAQTFDASPCVKIMTLGVFHFDYANLDSIFNDPARLKKFEDYYLTNPDSVYQLPAPKMKIKSVIDALIESNNPERVRERLSVYLLHPFKYEETPGDFTGVDFETGRWYNRNLRIFRNIQRIPHNNDDRILLIIGSEHLNLLNLFFDISREFELVSPLQYLISAKEISSR